MQLTYCSLYIDRDAIITVISIHKPGSVVLAIVSSGDSVVPSSSADTKSMVNSTNAATASKTIFLEGFMFAE